MIDWEQFAEENRLDRNGTQALTWWRDYCLEFNDTSCWKQISGRDEI